VVPSLLWSAEARAEVVVFFHDGSQVRVDEISIHTEKSAAVLRLTRGKISLSRTVPLANVKHVREFQQKLYASTRVEKFVDFELQAVSLKQPCCEPQQSNTKSPMRTKPAKRPPIGKVIGIRSDPLDAYRNSLEIIFPKGIPHSERGFARDLMRRQLIHNVYESSSEGQIQQEHFPETDTIKALSVQARSVNSSGKADWDSLEIEVDGISKRGAVVPIKNGTLRVTLWGLEQKLVRSHGNRFTGVPGKPIQLASWTRQITNSLHRQPMTLPLPHPLPEHNPRVFEIGDVHVQLIVPGVGVLESSISQIPLRHKSFIRDRQLAEKGTQFFPGETTVGSKRLVGTVHYNLTSLRPYVPDYRLWNGRRCHVPRFLCITNP